MKELLEDLIKGLVSQPKEVRVEESVGEEGAVHLSFSVAPEDMGLVIGKEGRIISALRFLLKIAATKAGKKVFLELKEESKNR